MGDLHYIFSNVIPTTVPHRLEPSKQSLVPRLPAVSIQPLNILFVYFCFFSKMAEAHDMFVPGTIHLVDAAWELSADNGRRQDRDIVLHPKPSGHVDDPLNWSYRRKLLSTLCMFV